MSQPPPNVLSFAASDPSSGAGSQADLLTLASLGCHPLSVITAITIQDTLGVKSVLPLEPEWVAQQAKVILNDVPVHAFKLGLLGSTEIISVIAEIFTNYPEIPVIMDPVLASGRGDKLTSKTMITAIQKILLPRVTVLTPNSPEARQLSGLDSDQPEHAETADKPLLDQCACKLLEMGCDYVLITGTHEATEQVTNMLFTHTGKIRSDTWQRLPHSYHGSGCTLASAIAAAVASGQSIPDSVASAQQYTWQSLNQGYQPGMGQFIPHRLYGYRN